MGLPSNPNLRLAASIEGGTGSIHGQRLGSHALRSKKTKIYKTNNVTNKFNKYFKIDTHKKIFQKVIKKKIGFWVHEIHLIP